MVIGDDWADPLANSQSSALRVAGPLRDSGRRRPDERWSEWFSGLQVTSIGSETILLGTLPDQSALHRGARSNLSAWSVGHCGTAPAARGEPRKALTRRTRIQSPG
jgi:hypothetical protein